MDWTAVKSLLLKEVIALMKNRVHGEAWLTSLEKSVDGERLGICMAIDVVSGALDPQLFADILEATPPVPLDAREEFGKVVNLPPRCENFVCSSNHYPNPAHDDVVYVRILELGDFIQFYVDRGYTRARTHVKRIKAMYFNDKDGVELSGMRKWWRGRLPSVWVTSFADLENLLEGVPEKLRGSIAYDAFGLVMRNGVGGKNKPELVAVRYPEQFNFSVGCSQPTTLDAWWVDSGAFYLAYGKQDSWGRTQSLTGSHSPQRERVHSHFKNLTPRYKTYYIGVGVRPAEERANLLRQGYLRLEEILKSKGAVGP